MEKEMTRFLGSRNIETTDNENQEILNGEVITMMELTVFADCHIRINNSIPLLRKSGTTMRLDDVYIRKLNIKEKNTPFTWWGISN